MNDNQTLNKTGSKRILSVDVLRGLTIVLMILVDNPGGKAFEILKHAEWIGLSLADFIFPSFITLIGVSMYFSYSKYNFKATKESVFRLIRRFVSILLFGWVLIKITGTISKVMLGQDFLTVLLDFSTFRIMGIFPRLALTSFFAGLIILLVHNKKVIIGIIVFLLVGYTVLLYFGNGFEMSESNILSVVDVNLFGSNHIYKMESSDGRIVALDPEGLLSTIPCISQALIGFLIGGLIKDKNKDNNIKIIYIFVVGFTLLVSGYIIGFFTPVSKNIWSMPFVLTTTGGIACMLALFTWIIDVKGYKKWCFFFQVYGSNAIISFAAMDIIWLVLARLKVTTAVYNFLLPVFFNITGIASLLTTVIFVLLLWIPFYFMYKNKIFIRL